VDFITSMDGCGAAEGWPGWWGFEGTEYERSRSGTLGVNARAWSRVAYGQAASQALG
jgi:hypothetical protein